MTTDITPMDDATLAEQVAIAGDLSKLSSEQRMQYYGAVCRSLGLNPLTRPFEYVNLNGKLVLYARRDAAEQLRKIHGVSVRILGREHRDDVYVVTVQATDRTGRTDESTGVVSLQGLRGEALANALMKAETKGKRRVTLSICGLGWPDESEIETIRGAVPVSREDAERPTTAARALPPPRPHRVSEPEIEEHTLAVNQLRSAARHCRDAGVQIDMPTADDVARTSVEGLRALAAAWLDAARESLAAQDAAVAG